MTFANPLVLWSFAVLVPVFLSSIRRKKPSFIFPTDESIAAAKKGSMKTRAAAKLDYLRLAAASLVIVALAGPQAKVDAMTRKEGLAVILAIDCSSTMAADDVKLGLGDLAGKEVRSGGQRTKRIDAARTVAIDFVKSRPDDIVGVVAFAAQAFTLSPPTFDHEWVERSLRRADTGLIKDGTAIGSGILASLGALEGIKAKGKAVILLTDGINNFGSVPPMVAAKAARALGIKIYTIGLVGEKGLVEAGDGSGRKIYKEGGIGIDERELKEIAKTTGGEYFRAENMDSLRASYAEIDKLEKAVIEEKDPNEYKDISRGFIVAALLLLILEIALGGSILMKIP